MTTSTDLMIVAMDVRSVRPVEPGDLSLALAGAEVIDLIGKEAVTLRGDRIVPGLLPATGDDLLDEAASTFVREEPYEQVEEWLWRRGRGLSRTYLAALERDGEVTWQRRRWNPLRVTRTAPADSPVRREATERWEAREPVLATLAAAVGIVDQPAEGSLDVTDEPVVTVLAAVHDAVMELEAVRQRRAIEEAAFDNVWRGE
ncbi:GPP34 family phosphoprotein [Streptomyces sp. NPDC059766]|uniref:GOLPH3/VPS74 family protein n=1 Tax=Streptomyces sp. NPDC059766 TaxID=3346940 RepID=UPI0036490328